MVNSEGQRNIKGRVDKGGFTVCKHILISIMYGLYKSGDNFNSVIYLTVFYMYFQYMLLTGICNKQCH